MLMNKTVQELECLLFEQTFYSERVSLSYRITNMNINICPSNVYSMYLHWCSLYILLYTCVYILVNVSLFMFN